MPPSTSCSKSFLASRTIYIQISQNQVDHCKILNLFLAELFIFASVALFLSHAQGSDRRVPGKAQDPRFAVAWLRRRFGLLCPVHHAHGTSRMGHEPSVPAHGPEVAGSRECAPPTRTQLPPNAALCGSHPRASRWAGSCWGSNPRRVCPTRFGQTNGDELSRRACGHAYSALC